MTYIIMILRSEKEWSRIKEFNIVNTYSMKGCIIDEIIYIYYIEKG